MPPQHNLITDISGVRIGNAHDEKLFSGVTVALIDGPAIASVAIRGGAPGGRDVTLLEPEMTVQGCDAVVLSGGSLFGLDAAGGVVSNLRGKGVGVRIGGVNIPIASQAITFDLLNGGNKSWGRMPPYWELGWQAADAARDGSFPLGSVGGGYGATTSTTRGGLGSASARVAEFTVGAIAVVNAVGSATIGSSPHFWAAPFEVASEFGGLGLPVPMPADALQLRIKGGAPPSTTIALVATDAALTKAECKRLALMADDGLARAIRPAHAPMDGDSVFAVATGRREMPPDGHERAVMLTAIGAAAADCLARAIARGVFEAAAVPRGWAGPPSWRERFTV